MGKYNVHRRDKHDHSRGSDDDKFLLLNTKLLARHCRARAFECSVIDLRGAVRRGGKGKWSSRMRCAAPPQQTRSLLRHVSRDKDTGAEMGHPWRFRVGRYGKFLY